MPIIRKGKDGRWYVWKRKTAPNSEGFFSQKAKKNVKWTMDWEVMPYTQGVQGRIRVHNITSYPELIGKKIRFVVEVIGEAEK